MRDVCKFLRDLIYVNSFGKNVAFGGKIQQEFNRLLQPFFIMLLKTTDLWEMNGGILSQVFIYRHRGLKMGEKLESSRGSFSKGLKSYQL